MEPTPPTDPDRPDPNAPDAPSAGPGDLPTPDGSDPGTPRRATAAWFVGIILFLLVAALQMLNARVLQAQASEAEKEAAAAVTAPSGPDEFTIQSKILVTGSEFSDGVGGGMLLRSMRDAARTPAEVVRAAVLEREIAGVSGDADPFDEACSAMEDGGRFKDLDEETRTGLSRDLELLRTAMADGPDALADDERQRLVDRHGWFARVALTHALDEAEERRRAVRREGVGVALLVGGFGLGFLTALVAGVALLIVGAWAISTGRLRWGFVRPSPGGSVYLEMFPLFVGAFLLHQLVSMLVSLIAGAIGGEDLGNTIGQWYSLIGQWALLAVIAWPLLVGVPWSRARRDLGLHAGRGVLREIGAGLVGYIAGLPLLIGGAILTFLLLAIFHGGEEGAAPSNPVMEQIQSSGPVMVGVLALLAVIWAPIVEETVFRGALYRHLRSRISGVLTALIVGLLFAFMHGYGPLFTPPLIALALTFSMLREWRGSLIAPMTAHLAHNAAVIGFAILLMRVVA